MLVWYMKLCKLWCPHASPRPSPFVPSCLACPGNLRWPLKGWSGRNIGYEEAVSETYKAQVAFALTLLGKTLSWKPRATHAAFCAVPCVQSCGSERGWARRAEYLTQLTALRSSRCHLSAARKSLHAMPPPCTGVHDLHGMSWAQLRLTRYQCTITTNGCSISQ